MLHPGGGTFVRLSRVQIENHSRLQDTEIEVRDHLVLVGANDVGKSSLLRCLDFVLGATTAQLYSRITMDDFRDPESTFAVEVTLQGLSSLEEAFFPDEIDVDPGSQTKTLTIRLEATFDESGTLQLQRSSPSGRTGRQISRDQLTALGWKLVGAVQGGARDFREERNNSLEDILARLDLGDERASFEKIAEQYQGRLVDSDVLRALRERLAGQLSKAVPERVKTDDLAFVTGIVATEDLLSDVRLQVMRNGIPRNMTQQSDGARALFAIALYDLVSESANIVAIDEPEIHLHPTSQRSLARLLRSGSNQKIIATHSPDIVGSFSPDHIVVVRSGGQLVQPNEGFLSEDERLIAHWWVKDKLEPLTASQVVLVEGAADRIILQRVAEVLDKDLDRIGVSLVEMGGAGDIGYVLTLFGSTGFDVPISILIDEDAVGDTARKYGVPEDALEDSGVFVCKKDLEDEYVEALGAAATWDAIEASGLFTKNEKQNCQTSGPNGQRTQEDVSDFCRKKSSYKVRAAIAVANTLSTENAEQMSTLVRLLKKVETLG
nr:AAA family ATPase [Paenarthrobacter ureafaciens]